MRIVVVASLGHKLGMPTIQVDDMNWDMNYGANPRIPACYIG